MAKDPAFLFYPGDWITGTMTLSRFLKGCYMDMLIAQFNSGPLSLEEIKTVLGSDFGTAWPSLQKKFKAENGLFFNERLEVEKAKRADFQQHQRDRVLKRWGKEKAESYPGINPGTFDGITPAIPYVNEDENKDESKKGKKEISVPTFSEFMEYAKTLQIYHPGLDFGIEAKYKAWTDAGWKDGFGKPIKVWKSKLMNTMPHIKPSGTRQAKQPISQFERLSNL